MDAAPYAAPPANFSHVKELPTVAHLQSLGASDSHITALYDERNRALTGQSVFNRAVAFCLVCKQSVPDRDISCAMKRSTGTHERCVCCSLIRKSALRTPQSSEPVQMRKPHET